MKSRFAPLLGGLFLLAAKAPAQEATSAGDPLQLLLQAGYWMIYLSLPLIVVWVVWHFRARLANQQQQDALADAKFEAQLLASLSTDRAPGPPAPPHAGTAGLAPPPLSLTPTPLPSQPPSTPAEADACLSRVLQQLQAASLLRSVEGYMELHGDPKAGALLLLSNGKRALLVPYFETEFFAARNLRRFDLLIYVARDGRAVVVSPLEALIAENLAPSLLPRR